MCENQQNEYPFPDVTVGNGLGLSQTSRCIGARMTSYNNALLREINQLRSFKNWAVRRIDEQEVYINEYMYYSLTN